MIQKVSVEKLDKRKYTPSLIKDKRMQNPAFTGLGDAIVNVAVKGIQRCEAEPMLNVTVLDLLTAIGPRSVIETVAGSTQKDENGNPILDENGKPKRKFNFLAGLEAFRRESSGLFINCILPGVFVMGSAALMNKSIMGKNSNLIKNWADRDTLETFKSFYQGKGADNYAQMLKNMFLDLKGADGAEIDKAFADIYRKDPKAFDDIFNHLGKMADAQKLDKKAVKRAVANIIDLTHISENIKFTTNNPKNSYFGNTLDSLMKNAVEVLHDAKKAGIESADDFGKYIAKAKKLVKWKSIGGMSIIIPLAISAQPINRWITHKSAGGKKGAPIYNDDKERVLTKEEKQKLLKQKFISIGSMLGLSWLSMMKMPSMSMIEFKKFFPSMDQARLVSTATFASRMGASEDFNDLRESTVRDLATFSSFYFLGDYAAKGIASFLEWKHKDKGIKLINDLKPLDKGANILQKAWHWTKHTALKSTDELATKEARNLRSICQIGNITFSLLSLGIFIPLINRIQTNKKEQERIANAKSSGAPATPVTGSTTGTDKDGSSLLKIDKKSTAFGAFFNS